MRSLDVMQHKDGRKFAPSSHIETSWATETMRQWSQDENRAKMSHLPETEDLEVGYSLFA